MRAAERVRGEDWYAFLDSGLIPLPDCAHCRAASTLEPVYVEMGVTFAVCSCCSRTTRIDYEGIAHKVEPRRAVEPITPEGHLLI